MKFPQSFGSIKPVHTRMHDTGVVHAIRMTPTCSTLSFQPSSRQHLYIPDGLCRAFSVTTALQEFNHDKETVRSLQIWMTPDRKGHTPQYGSNRYTKADRHNKLLLILGGSKEVPSWNGIAPGKGIKLHQVFNPTLLTLTAFKHLLH